MCTCLYSGMVSSNVTKRCMRRLETVVDRTSRRPPELLFTEGCVLLEELETSVRPDRSDAAPNVAGL
jgi:hypothetical protein